MKKYTENHEWIEWSDRVITVGITDFAQKQLGDVVSIELPEVGTTFRQDDPMAVMDSVKASSDIYSPVDGRITQVNEDLLDHPELVNQSPYERGWIARMEPSRPDQTESLLSEAQYNTLTGG